MNKDTKVKFVSGHLSGEGVIHDIMNSDGNKIYFVRIDKINIGHEHLLGLTCKFQESELKE